MGSISIVTTTLAHHTSRVGRPAEGPWPFMGPATRASLAQRLQPRAHEQWGMRKNISPRHTCSQSTEHQRFEHS